MEIARRYDGEFEENVIVVVDDSHGVGAFGRTGRGTEEYTDSGPVDILLGTLGKALGVNGGYVVASTGPTVVGAVHEATAGWTAPLLVVLGAIILLGTAGTFSAGLTGSRTG